MSSGMDGGVTPGRRVRIVLAYDGTDYCGWQNQPRLPTIQGELERVLTRIDGDRPVRVHGAGRTDSGVHACGQVADCVLVTGLNDRDLLYTLHRMLPAAIRPRAVDTVAAAFDSRRCVHTKRYIYRVDRTPHGDPFVQRYAMHYRQPLDIDAVDAALELLPGRRDWSGFAGADCDKEDRVRTLSEAGREAQGHEIRFLFTSDGFLNHMVRNIVGTLLEIGRGRMTVERIGEILASHDRGLAGPTAPAHGLCLERITYPEEA